MRHARRPLPSGRVPLLNKDKDMKMQITTPLTYPAIGAVRLGEDFFGRRFILNAKITIPFILGKLREVGVIDNFKRAAGLLQGDYVGLHNSDEFLYKAVEAASWTLLYGGDPGLDAELDVVVAAISGAQEDDGYLRTPHTIHWLRGGATARAARWSSLNGDLELYSLGHLYEASVAHYLATGKRTLLDVAERSAALVERLFGEGGQLKGVDMIPEIELALVALGKVTGNERCKALALRFLEERGNPTTRESMGSFSLDHLPLQEQQEAVGHATFAAYLYSAAADLAAEGRGEGLGDAARRLWDNATSRKMSVIGGFGSRHDIEGFGEAFDLPNLTSYNEVCAAVGFALLAPRLFRIDRDGRYFDVMERILYNNILSGVSLDGNKFFYVCPTASDAEYPFNLGWCPEGYDGPYAEPSATRKEWIPCACCPPTLARAIPQIPKYVYAVDGDSIYVNLFLASEVSLTFGDVAVDIEQSGDYPWDGTIQMEINVSSPIEFSLRPRIPGWARNQCTPGNLYSFLDESREKASISIDGHDTVAEVSCGYAELRRLWRGGERVVLRLPMKARRVIARPEVSEDRGKVSLQRGPLVYCAEAVDNGGKALSISLPDDARIESGFDPDVLGGLHVLRWESQEASAASRLCTAIPYFAWSNRGPGEMAVWFDRQ